jgi:hypothetical protein
MVQYRIDDDLRLLHDLDRSIKSRYLRILGINDLLVSGFLFSLPVDYGRHLVPQLLFILFADIQSIVDFKVDGMSFRLLHFFLF